MIVYIAGFIAMGTAGFVIGGAWAAFVFVISWSALLTAYWHSRSRKEQIRRHAEDCSLPEMYKDIDAIFERLGDIAHEHGWDIEKQLEIAGLACERRDMTFDQLERLYERGVRSSLGKNRRYDSESWNNGEPTR